MKRGAHPEFANQKIGVVVFTNERKGIKTFELGFKG